MGRLSVPIPFGRKNVSKSEWNDFIEWQKYRNEERMRFELMESDLYISSRELSPETWESVLNELSSSSNLVSIEESPTSVNNEEDKIHSGNINNNISGLDFDSIEYKRHKCNKSEYKSKSDNKDKGLASDNDDKNYSDSDEDYGPMPMAVHETAINKSINDEPQIAEGKSRTLTQYALNDNRISRKAAGMTPEEVEKYESLGYVMSGSSHWRMNQAKLLKEKEHYSVEDQRSKAILNPEERANKEVELINNLKEMLKKQNDIMDKSNM
ncbi:UPF0396 protein [Babesia microti strain RI]|uniref:UPF0396 protein n=1 Tax=Babesia microti (strain RI) TaxID=1133968 RepID=A0A1N6LY78_BABMR|nr:UPF0396 protein [Babesia microti strain RI]SIO73836.1 UPF0396 protein [Babesia microti strain RI]|eukprot:XP_021337891.1 UPF0396 protein [Babesia microti strain RI]